MIPTRKFLQAAAIFVAVVLALSFARRLGCVSSRPDAGPGGGRVATVTTVYDGDTVDIAGLGTVRLIGVDAMDSRSREKIASQSRHLSMSREEVIRWGREAEDFARETLQGREVRVEFGRDRRGDYGRTLAYLHVEMDGSEVNFNRLLIEKGLATAYRAFDYRMKGEFLRVESRAREEGRGLWKKARSSQ